MRVNNEPNTKVVQVAGLHFQISRLRARRGLRGVTSLIDLLGAAAVSMITGTGTASNGVTVAMLLDAAKGPNDTQGLSGPGKMLVKAAILGGHMNDPDTVERVANELITYTDGEGVQVSTDGAAWMPIHGLASLDRWEMIGYMEMLDLLRHVIAFQFFPTSAGPATSDDTGPADATTAGESATSGASPGVQTSAPSGLVSG